VVGTGPDGPATPGCEGSACQTGRTGAATGSDRTPDPGSTGTLDTMYYVGGIAIGIVLVVVLVMGGAKVMRRGRD
jgi:hypothetical protein